MRIKNWLEMRIGLDDLIRTQLTEYRVPRNINITYTFGFVALVAFLIQVITGFFLLIYYIPYSEMAFRSVQDIMSTVPYGWLFRQIHVVGSNLMIVMSFSIPFPCFSWEAIRSPESLPGSWGRLCCLPRSPSASVVICFPGAS